MDRGHAAVRVFFAVALAAALLGTRPAPAIEFAASLEEARRAAGDADRLVLLTFSSPTCGWCRKMASSTFASEQLDRIEEKFLWVRVDVEDEPGLAARLQVGGVPHTVVLDAKDRVIASQPGYMPPASFLKFVDAALANPVPLEVVESGIVDALDKLESVTSDERRKAVEEAIVSMSRFQAANRELLLQRFEAKKDQLRPILIELLGDERLAIRATAIGTLHRLKLGDLPFDPFADAQVRKEQVAAWSATVETEDSGVQPDAE